MEVVGETGDPEFLDVGLVVIDSEGKIVEEKRMVGLLVVGRILGMEDGLTLGEYDNNMLGLTDNELVGRLLGTKVGEIVLLIKLGLTLLTVVRTVDGEIVDFIVGRTLRMEDGLVLGEIVRLTLGAVDGAVV